MNGNITKEKPQREKKNVLYILRCIYSVFIGILPLLMFVRLPFTEYGLGTFFALLFVPFVVFCMIKERKKFNFDGICLIVFFVYILIRSINSKSALLCYMAAFIHITGIYATIEWKVLKKTIVSVSVFSSLAVLYQRYLLLFGLKVSFLPNPILLSEFAKKSSLYDGKTFIRTSGIFIEPSHFAEYALIGLIFLVITANARKVKKSDYLWAFIISLAILGSTSGVGIAGLAGVIGFYILFVGFGEKQPVYKRFIVLISIMVLGFGLMFLIPTTRYSLIRIWGKVNKYNAVWGRTAHFKYYMSEITGAAQWIFGKGATEFEHFLLAFAKIIYQFGFIGLALLIGSLGSFVFKKNRTVMAISLLYIGFLFSTGLVRFLNLIFYFGVIMAAQATFREIVKQRTEGTNHSLRENRPKKLGLVTYSNYNYGSALQCYATQKYFSQKGCECVLIEKNDGKFEAKLDQIINAILAGIISPGSIKQIAARLKAQSAKSLTLTAESVNAVKTFKKSFVQTEHYSHEELYEEGDSPDYDYFLAGSDQVWNGDRIDGYDMFFLRFAAKEKRIAWAPSFSGESVAKYNLAKYRKYISAFFKLSVREETGRKLVYDLTKREAEVLCDPVMLLSKEEWQKEYKDHTNIHLPESFVMAFFIDEPSEKAISMLRKFSSENRMIVSFGYRYAPYKEIASMNHIDGSPYDFLNLLDNALYVVTDSYHATVFSALFHKPFLVYERNYTHAQNQSVRIKDFLNDIGASDRWEVSSQSDPGRLSDDSEVYVRTDMYLKRMKEKADAYTEPLLGNG